MYTIILGAGRIGASLATVALEHGHDVAIIEADKDQAKIANERFDALVLNGDIAEGNILEEAHADQADALVATTGDDSANLMAMFLGADLKIPRLISVVNERLHQKLFKRLGVVTLDDPNVILAQYLFGLLREPTVSDVISLSDGAEMLEVALGATSPLVGLTAAWSELEKVLPKTMSIITIERDDKVSFPAEDLVMKEGDRVRVFSLRAISERQFKIFTG